jgi:DNA-binding LacI/PurR family transcriptional regulator/signal transduction histidine kinase/DNA-binding NarL/FixJ family response regulator
VRVVIRLVIVDDNSMVLGALRALFETTTDFSVVGEGADGAEAIAAARETGADAVLMDLSMPRMDGIEACRRLAVECPTTKVIIYSALGGERRMAAAMAAGAAAFIGKDLAPEELLSRVRSIAAAEASSLPSRPAEPVAHVEAGSGAGASPAPQQRAQPDPALEWPPKTRAPTTSAPGKPGLTIGVLAPLLGGGYMTKLMSGIGAAADAAGARLIAIQTLDPGGLWPGEHALAEVAGRVPIRDLRVSWDRVDGFLVVITAVERRFLDVAAAAGKPTVVVSEDIHGFLGPTVQADNRSGTMQAVAHLIMHGHRRIAFAGYQSQSDIRERLDGYRDALTAHGIEPDDSLVFAASDNVESGGEVAARSMLAAGLPSTAVMAATDFNAIGIMKVLSEAGLSLPHDQAVVGFDGVPAGLSTRPTLSTVHQNLPEIGRLAVDLLTQSLDGRKVAPGRHPVPTVFVARESCGCAFPAGTESFAGAEGSAEQHFHERLERLLSGLDVLSVTQRQSLERGTALILRLVGQSRIAAQEVAAELREACLTLLAVSPHWATIAGAEACLQAYWNEITRDSERDGRTSDFERFLRKMVVEMSRSLSEIESTERTQLQLTLDAERDVSTSIIRGGVEDPSSLDWLAYTAARAGCLGIWSDDPVRRIMGRRRLRIVGSFLRGGSHLSLPGQVAVEAFPPQALIDQHEPGEIVAVVPVKTRSMDLGLLALVVPIVDTEVSDRDRLFDKGALLGMSLQREITSERLRRSNEDLATFSGAMAHDLRNPLATILMWTSVAPTLAGPDDRAEPVLQAVERIREVATYSNELIAQLMRYAELEGNPAPAEPVDLDLVVSRASAALESIVRESGAVIKRHGLPTVVTDAAGLEVVMENLISNAIRYRRGVPPQVVIEASCTEDAWEIRCRDNGTGIPADLLDDIFQPFVRGDPAMSGSGLGLATCRRTIERLGGRIWVAKTSETGTCIAFTLPVEAPHPAPDGTVTGPSISSCADPGPGHGDAL